MSICLKNNYKFLLALPDFFSFTIRPSKTENICGGITGTAISKVGTTASLTADAVVAIEKYLPTSTKTNVSPSTAGFASGSNLYFNSIGGMAMSRKLYASGSCSAGTVVATCLQRKMFWLANNGDAPDVTVTSSGTAITVAGGPSRRIAVHRDNNGEPVLILDFSGASSVDATADWESLSLGAYKVNVNIG